MFKFLYEIYFRINDGISEISKSIISIIGTFSVLSLGLSISLSTIGQKETSNILYYYFEILLVIILIFMIGLECKRYCKRRDLRYVFINRDNVLDKQLDMNGYTFVCNYYLVSAIFAKEHNLRFYELSKREKEEHLITYKKKFLWTKEELEKEDRDIKIQDPKTPKEVRKKLEEEEIQELVNKIKNKK